MKFSALRFGLPSIKSVILSIVAAILLVLAFPDFDFWILANIALMPLLFAVEREKESVAKSFLIGWLFGTLFFTGSCWWLTYSLITYGGIPMPIAYLLLLIAAAMVGVFPAIFTTVLSFILKRFGSLGILATPFVWTAAEFLRFYLTGNNWNAIAYSQAFSKYFDGLPSVGGIYLVGFFIASINASFSLYFTNNIKSERRKTFIYLLPFVFILISIWTSSMAYWNRQAHESPDGNTKVVAVQPNVPMGGMKYAEWIDRRNRHVELAENALQKLKSESSANEKQKIIVVFPESPMNFGYTNDREFQQYLREFTTRNNVEVLFNAAEPSENDNFYNSAVLVNERAEKIAQYDKIHLVPFGEYVPLPAPLAQRMPTMAGSFEFGKEYDIVPFGDAKAGIMICFESHFPTLSREFALRGADVLIEMTNDGYLGETPVLRQHLASAVYRALETNRPVLRATNVGITAYINERGEVSDELKPYTEGWRIWSIAKSDGEQTFYVKYGDWVAWLSIVVSLGLIIYGFLTQRRKDAETQGVIGG